MHSLSLSLTHTHTHEIKEGGDEIFDKLNELKRSKLCSLEIIMLRKDPVRPEFK
jgi:hypothetical protein